MRKSINIQKGHSHSLADSIVLNLFYVLSGVYENWVLSKSMNYRPPWNKGKDFTGLRSMCLWINAKTGYYVIINI